MPAFSRDRLSIKSISVLGLGHVGLATACCLASAGFTVHGFDVDKKKLEVIGSGRVPFREARVQSLLRNALRRTLDVGVELIPSDLYVVAVGTPSRRDGSIELGQVLKASKALGTHFTGLTGFRIVAIKSTVTPGTTDGLVWRTIEKESRKRVPEDIGLVANPEFLREGSAVEDTLHPDRVVIGEADRGSGDAVEKMYREFYEGVKTTYLRTSTINAELIKYASNAFLATKVSFINTIADLASRLPGADVNVVARGVGMDKRIGPDFLRAGLGYGGSCFPKDVKAMISVFRKLRVNARLLQAVEETNLERVAEAVRLAEKHLGSLKGKRVALLGLSFKPDTDDIREAVSGRLIDKLLREGSRVIAYDPLAVENARKVYHRKIRYAQSAREAVKGADCCFLVTEWDEFRRMSPLSFESMRRKVIIDGRLALDHSKFADVETFEAVGLGKP